jgi:hypothetical protein
VLPRHQRCSIKLLSRALTISLVGGRKFAPDKCFDAAVLSGEVNDAKPDPRAFAAALNDLAVRPTGRFLLAVPTTWKGRRHSACIRYFVPPRRRLWLPPKEPDGRA